MIVELSLVNGLSGFPSLFKFLLLFIKLLVLVFPQACESAIFIIMVYVQQLATKKKIASNERIVL